MRHRRSVAVVVALLALARPAGAASPVPPIPTEQLVAEVTEFLDREVAAHVTAVGALDPPPKTVFGAPTAGDFTWGSFMRALTEYSALTGRTTVAGRSVPEVLGRLGLVESRLGGKTWSQLGAALALRRFGTDLAHNAVWQGLSPAEQDEWRALLDPGRFYDAKTHHVINLPENYMGVASRIAAYDVELGLAPDRAFADEVLTRAAGQFLQGALYADDNLPTGRFDRYSQEYARFIDEASRLLDRKDVQAAVAPSLKAVMPTWWALVGPDGYGYPWGRTIGDMSYLDSMEIVGYLADHPDLRPAPLADLASVYYQAWHALLRDYRTERHLLDMFGFGRGSYHYMTPERQWQQTTGFLFKSADSARRLLAALRTEGVAGFPASPRLPDVARFDFFRKGDRPAGAWLVRQGDLRFALPISTGTRPGIADYLPAPHGLPGFAAPVEQVVPALVPYLELADGRIVVAGDGADEIVPASDGRSLRAVWRRFAPVSAGGVPETERLGEAATYVEPGLTTEVTWSLEADGLVRRETITAAAPVHVRRFWVMVPSSGDELASRPDGLGGRFRGREGTLDVDAVASGFKLRQSLQATGNGPLGKGTRGPIPLVLTLEARDLTVAPGAPLAWTMRLKTTPPVP
jgi:hypothetical protein